MPDQRVFEAAVTDMSDAEFRKSAQAVIDWVAAYLRDPREYPASPRCRPGALLGQLPAAAPVTGEPIAAILKDFEEIVLPGVTHWNHPCFHAYFSISSSAPGILGELLTAALNVNAMLWQSCPAATELEQVTLSWALEWLSLPPTWFGMMLDSASSGVLHAMIAARQKSEPQSRVAGPSGRLAAYVSEQTHSSIEKAAIAAGIGAANVRHVAVDRQFRMRPEDLARAIESDVALGLRPFFAAATVGTTSSAAIDPVPEIAAICREHSIWLHVDGAYGGAFGLLPECRYFLDGVDQADSFVLNAHKTMLVPMDCSLLYTPHKNILRDAFSLRAAYLNTDAGTVDFMDYGIALGRRFRALKLWMVMRYFGRDGLTAMLRGSIRMAAWLAKRISGDQRFELAAPASMGLVCFRLREGDEATKKLMDEVNASGQFFLSHTVLDGRFTIRTAIGNLRTRQQDIEDLWNAIEHFMSCGDARRGAGA